MKTSVAAESIGMAKGMSGHDTRGTPKNETRITATTVHETNQNKLDCQMSEKERQWVDRSDQFAETKSKEHAVEKLTERTWKLEEQSRDVQTDPEARVRECDVGLSRMPT